MALVADFKVLLTAKPNSSTAPTRKYKADKTDRDREVTIAAHFFFLLRSFLFVHPTTQALKFGSARTAATFSGSEMGVQNT